MPENYKISVIIPVYQIETYIEECVQSMIQSTIFERCEFIFVDDGSRDKSASVIKEYEEKYTNIILIQKKNGGAGTARNQGILYAHGDFLYFVDGDDFISKNRLQNLYECAREYNCDLVVASYQEFTGTMEHSCKTDRDYLLMDQPISGWDMLQKRMDYSDWMNQSVTIMVDRKLLLKHNIMFPEENVLYEDIVWLNKCMIYAKKVRYISDDGYYYRKRVDSAVSHINGTSEKDIVDSIKCLEALEKWYQEENEKNKQVIGRLLLRMVVMPIQYINEMNGINKRYYYRKVKKMKLEKIFLKSAKTNVERIKAVIYSISICLFAVVLEEYTKR